ncbi:MAG TPA: flagellar basal-body MS-ring/collar protein FliF [Acetobacteraceae bacterium]|nr:flagellar basal-body MS-ring/collar protein FliF [Acetobacteraceae bacterium]
MQPLIAGLRALGPARLAALGAVGLGMLALLALLVLNGGARPMALLYADLDLRDSAQIVDQLTHAHIPYRLAASGSEIMVPDDQVPQARVLLAQQGLPSGGTVGYEIFDRSETFGATEFQQRIDETRALEGELARTIRAINGVRAVRVHLVLPQRAAFARDQETAQASVLLTMAGAGRLDSEGVRAILNLVAAAVPGLKPQNIAIVDSHGELLARAGQPLGPEASAMSADEIRRATELRLARAVEEMLERSLGVGHVRAEAAVRMDFDHVSVSEEKYDPDGQVPRSEQSVTNQNDTTQATPTVSVQNNLPNAPAATQGTGTHENRHEETTNYEISKTVRTLVHQQPQISRISLAVMVDAAKAQSPPDLARITELVKTAIGFDEKRGDDVKVVSMPFATDTAGTPATTPELFGLPLQRTDILHLAEIGLIGLIGVLALQLVLRPMVLRITTLAPPGRPDLIAASATAYPIGGPAPAVALAAPVAGSAGLLEDESMVNLAQVEGQMRASSIRRVSELVERHPDETLTIVRGWMLQEGG